MSFGCPQIRLMEVCRTIFGRLQVIESAKLSSVVLKSLCNLLRMFHANPSAEHSAGYLRNVPLKSWRGTMFLRIPSNVSADTQQCFCVYPAMFPRIICDDFMDGSRKSASCRMEIRRKPTREICRILQLTCGMYCMTPLGNKHSVPHTNRSGLLFHCP